MRRAPTPGRGPRHGPAAARRRGGRTAAQPAPAPGRGSKVRGAAATPPEFPPRARSQPRPSPVAGPGPWAEGTGGSRRHLPAAPRPHSALAGRDSEALGRTSPPPTRTAPPSTPAGMARTRRPRQPRESQLPPPGPPPQVPAAAGSEPGLPRARTHLGFPAPPPLPGCSAPGPRSAPFRARPLRPPRLWPPPAALLRAPVGEGAPRDMGETGGRRRESLCGRPEGRGSSPWRLLGSPL